MTIPLLDSGSISPRPYTQPVSSVALSTVAVLSVPIAVAVNGSPTVGADSSVRPSQPNDVQYAFIFDAVLRFVPDPNARILYLLPTVISSDVLPLGKFVAGAVANHCVLTVLFGAPHQLKSVLPACAMVYLYSKVGVIELGVSGSAPSLPASIEKRIK